MGKEPFVDSTLAPLRQAVRTINSKKHSLRGLSHLGLAGCRLSSVCTSFNETRIQAAALSRRRNKQRCRFGNSAAFHTVVTADRKMTSSKKRDAKQYDPWYAKVTFGVLLSVLVGSLIALHAGVPVPHFIVARWHQAPACPPKPNAMGQNFLSLISPAFG